MSDEDLIRTWRARNMPDKRWSVIGEQEQYSSALSALAGRVEAGVSHRGHEVEILSPLGIVTHYLVNDDLTLTQTGGPVPFETGRDPAPRAAKSLGGFGGPPDGLTLITKERKRQVEEENWTPEHDDDHDAGELALAAACYAVPPETHLRELVWKEKRGNPYGQFVTRDPWPWDRSWDKRPQPGASKDQRIRALVKAGALIAAEIDRLNRRKS